MMIGGIGGGNSSGGPPRIAKPHGRSMALIENPLALLGPTERKAFDAKWAVLQRIKNSNHFGSAPFLSELKSRLLAAVHELFPGASLLLLAKRGTDYVPLLTEGSSLEVASLNLSADNSIIKKAGEIEPGERRTIYFPDVEQSGIVFASKFDRVSRGGGYQANGHEMEEGTLDDTGLGIDILSLKRARLGAIAVSPVLEYKHHDPIAAIVLIGERAFLNPYADLILLRDLADLLAVPLKEKLT